MTEQTNGDLAARRSPVKFFALVFALAIPVWALSRFTGVIGALKVPVTDLVLGFTPLIAAVILIWREEGRVGVGRLFRRAVDVRGMSWTWLAVSVLLAPAIYLAAFGLVHLAGHGGAAHPRWASLPLLAAVIALLALGEEGGWTGYAIDPMQQRWGALGASLLIAVPWWLGHVPSILQIGGTAADLAWWIPGALGLRVLFTWLYNNSGRSLASAVIFHTLLNVARIAIYPTQGTHYDPVYQAVGYSLVAVLAVIVVAVWGARTLARGRPA